MLIKPTKAGGLTGQNDIHDLNMRMDGNTKWRFFMVQIEQSKLEMVPTKDE